MNEANTGKFQSGYKLPPALDTAYRTMLRICDYIAALALATEVVLITINVTGRYVFSHTFGWMNEFAQYTLLWLIVPGTVVLMDRYALFYAEVLLLFIQNQLVRRMLFVFNSILMLVFFAIVFWTGIDYVKITWTFELDYSDLQKYWFYVTMPIWGILMLIVVLKKLVCMENPDVTAIDPED